MLNLAYFTPKVLRYSSEVREGVTLIETAYIEELLTCVQVEAKLQ